MSYQGDYVEDDTVNFAFSTRTTDNTGMATLSGTPALSVYKDGGTTQSTAGITLTVDLDSVTGLNHVSIDTSADAFYATGADYDVVITTGTVDSVSVVGEVVGSFSIENRVGATASDRVLLALPAAAADAAGGLPISDAGGLDLDTKLANTNEITAARMGALTDWIDGGRLDLIIDAILVDTGTTLDGKINTIDGIVDDILLDTAEIGAAGAGLTEAGGTGDHLTAVPWNASWDAEVQSEVNDALVALNLDHLCAVATAAADMTAEVVDNSIISRVLSNGDTSVFDPSTDGLQPIRDRGDAAWVTATGFSTLDAAGVRTAVGLASANLDTQLGDIPTVSEFNARTLAAADYFDPAADTVANVTTVGSVTTKTGYSLVSTGLDAVTAWTVDITGDVTGNLSGSVGSVTGNVGGVAGTITTLDALDTAQDSQHSTTQGLVTTVDTVVDGIKAITDAIGATAAANLARTLGSAGVVFFTAETGTLSTTVATTDLTETTDDHYNGRVIVWLTGDLAGQVTDITDYSGTNGTLTFTALTEAPSNGNTGIIV